MKQSMCVCMRGMQREAANDIIWQYVLQYALCWE